MIEEIHIENFAKQLNPKFSDEISIGKTKFKVINNCDISINNQHGDLRDGNYLGRNFEYTLQSDKLEIPIAIQLYLNVNEHYRVYCFTKNGKMLSSFNLSTGYNGGIVDINIQIKITEQKLTKEERQKKRDDIIELLYNEGLTILPKNIVHLGSYDTVNDIFINTTPEKLMIDFLKVCLTKGYYDILNNNQSINNNENINSFNNESIDKYLGIIQDNACIENIEIDLKKPKKIVLNSKEKYARDIKVASNAILIANYECEIDSNHKSFIRKSNGKNYTEAHHLIPMEFQDNFEYSLDVEANIVSICSNCHNCLHYGLDKEKILLLEQLYNNRIDRLNKVGLSVTFDELKKFYKIESL